MRIPLARVTRANTRCVVILRSLFRFKQTGSLVSRRARQLFGSIAGLKEGFNILRGVTGYVGTHAHMRDDQTPVLV